MTLWQRLRLWLLSFILLLFGSIAILGSQPGLRLLQWCIEQYWPSIQMSPIEGSLWRGFVIADIRLQSDTPPATTEAQDPASSNAAVKHSAQAQQTLAMPDTRPWLHIQGLQLQLDIGCGWQQTLCVESLMAEAVQLDDTQARPEFLNQPAATTSAAPLQLPMQWRHIAIHHLSLHTTDLRLELEQLQTAAEFNALDLSTPPTELKSTGPQLTEPQLAELAPSMAANTTLQKIAPYSAILTDAPPMTWQIGATTLHNLTLYTPMTTDSKTKEGKTTGIKTKGSKTTGSNTKSTHNKPNSSHQTTAKAAPTPSQLAILQQFQRWLDDPAQQLPVMLDISSLSIQHVQWQQVRRWQQLGHDRYAQRKHHITPPSAADASSASGNAAKTSTGKPRPSSLYDVAGQWHDIQLQLTLQPRQLQLKQLSLRQSQLLAHQQQIKLSADLLLSAPQSAKDAGQLKLQLTVDGDSIATARAQVPAFAWQLQSQGPLSHIALQSTLHITGHSTSEAKPHSSLLASGLMITSTGELNLRAPNLPVKLHSQLPALQLPLVHWQHMDLQLAGDLAQVNTTLSTEFTTEKGISGQLSLHGSLDTFAKRWAVEQLRIQTLNGEITAALQLDLASQQLQSQWQFLQLRPGFYLGDDSARLNGTVTLNVDLATQALSLPALNLEGVLYQQPFHTKGDVSIQITNGLTAQSIKSKNLLLQHGPNRLELQGEFSSGWALQGRLSVTDLALTIPQADGQLSATFDLSGQELIPDLKLNLSAKELNYQDDYQFKDLSLALDIHAMGHAPSAITLQLGASQAPDLQLKQLVFELNGTRAAHDSHLLLESHQLNAVLRQSGQWTEQDWRSQWQSVRVASDFGDWQLNEPIETLLQRSGHAKAKPTANAKTSQTASTPSTAARAATQATTASLTAWRLQLPAHCWSHVAAADKNNKQNTVTHPTVVAPTAATSQTSTTELCLRNKAILSKAQGELALVLRYIDLATLSSVLPNAHNLQGRADADLTLAWQRGKLQQAQLNATLRQGAYQYQSLRELKVPWQQASLAIGLTPEQLDANIQLQFSQTAHLNSRISIMQPGQPNATIAANAQLSQIDLAFLHPFLNEYSQFKGHAAGDLRLQGDLYRPAIYGELIVSDLDLTGNEAPVTLQKSSATLRFDGFSAQLSSSLTTPDGPIALSGHAHWQQLPWYAKLQLQSAGFQLHHSTGTLRVAPDLSAEITPFAQSLVGKISIPSGQIKVNQLPASATGVSADEVILNADGSEANLAAGPQTVQADIRLILGDKVKIAGFGLQSQLQGELRYRQQNQQKMLHGQMQLKKGTFTALGQDLQIRKGVLTFNGPVTNPLLTVDAIRNPARTEDNVIAGLRIHGLADNPQVQVFSEPSKPQANAFAYLLMGRDLNPSNNSDNMLAGSLINLGIGQSSNLVGKVGNLVGVDDLNVDTSGSGNKAKVEISGYLSPRLQVKYGVGIFDKFGEFTARYRIGQNLYVEAVQGLDSALDLLYKFEFD